MDGLEVVRTVVSMDVGGTLIVVSALVIIIRGVVKVKILHSSKG